MSEERLSDGWKAAAKAQYAILEAQLAEAVKERDAPVDMLLWCPNCGAQHIDAPDERTPDWTNPPHKSHLCHACAWIWRPSDRPTNGVATIKTHGEKDKCGVPQIAALVKEKRRLRAALSEVAESPQQTAADVAKAALFEIERGKG
jgi:hypothetical protein